jgi:hypothetical protein
MEPTKKNAVEFAAGLSEAIGVLSVLLFAISAYAVLCQWYALFFDRSSTSLFVFIYVFIFAGVGVLVSTAGTVFGFRSYASSVLCVLVWILQTLVCLLVLFTWAWLMRVT